MFYQGPSDNSISVKKIRFFFPLVSRRRLPISKLYSCLSRTIHYTSTRPAIAPILATSSRTTWSLSFNDLYTDPHLDTLVRPHAKTPYVYQVCSEKERTAPTSTRVVF